MLKNAGSVLGTALDPFELIMLKRILHKSLSIMDNIVHPLNN